MSPRGATARRHRAGRHRVAGSTGPGARIAVGGAVLLVAVTAVAAARLTAAPAAATQPAARARTTSATPTPGGPTSPVPTSAGPTSAAPTAAPSPSASTASRALAALHTLVGAVGQNSTSVAALDTTTGATVSVGAARGMTTASAVKVELLESLLLQRQRAGETLSSSELASATAMIEHSDNGAADDVFLDVGGHDAVAGLENDLGLSTTRTVLGDDDYWGLTTTGATQQLVLLRNLVGPRSPLDAASRRLAQGLMRNVEADQTWGVPVAATSGTSAVKNGWLGVDSDGGRWAVNSLGVVTVDGDTVLMAILTQHNDSYADGVARVQRLAYAAAAAVRS